VKKPELLAPGGSFLSAHAAFTAGADGVYLGLKEFSARKAAQNFSMDQLRRIRRLAADAGRKVYVAVNTVIRESELARLSEIFTWLQALAVDGVIVQDFGAYHLLKREFPGLAIHASTQMAVHNDAGLQMAEDMGIRRVILSRELTFDHIREMRRRHPGIELEVFVHGALCYSFSGACLASSALTGRSANRGDCAQICRSLFHDESGDCANGHYFSCRDLFLGREVLKLADIGIDALKIEGRMKSPEYAYNVTRLYREILDRGSALEEEEYAELVRRAELGFSREKTTGWLHSSSGSGLIDQRYPGHRGALLGTVDAVQGREIRIRIAADLSLRDGMGYFLEGEREPVIFSVSRIWRAGRETKFARAGEVVSIEVPTIARASAPGGVGEGGRARASAPGGVGGRPTETGRKLPQPGAEIRHLSSRFLDLPEPKETSFPLYQVPLDMRVGLSQSGVLSVRAAKYPLFERTVTMDRASRKRPFMEILAPLLAESGDSLFMPGNLSFSNETGLADDEIFIPPSQLKKTKNELYAVLDKAFLSSTRASAEPSAHQPAAGADGLPYPDAWRALSPAHLAALAHRQAMAPGQGPVDDAIPFAGSAPHEIDPHSLFLHAGFRWLPLPPVIDNGLWTEALRGWAERHPDTRFAIGLNNLSHLAIASALAACRNVWFFADFYLYVANRRALSFIRERVPRLLFAYAWIEGERDAKGEAHDGGPIERPAGTAAHDGVPLVQLAQDFRPPLFYSLGCFARHISGAGKCQEGCPKDFTSELRQGRNRFKLVVRDCVTWLFALNRK
jgi:putative protease